LLLTSPFMKTLLISGGSSGIGQATALHFVHMGFHVYEISRSGVSHDGIIHIKGDVTQPEDCRNAVRLVVEKEGGIDVLICNAGIGVSGAIEFCSTDDMYHQMDVNFFGVVNLIQAALQPMRERQKGRILIVSSLASVFSIPFQSFYSASKSAVNALALSLRNELAPFGIQVGVLLPGDVRSGFTASRNKSQVGSGIYTRMQQSVANMEKDETHGQSVERIARRLFSMSQCKYLPVFNYEGWGYLLLVVVSKVLPATLVNKVVGWLY